MQNKFHIIFIVNITWRNYTDLFYDIFFGGFVRATGNVPTLVGILKKAMHKEGAARPRSHSAVFNRFES